MGAFLPTAEKLAADKPIMTLLAGNEPAPNEHYTKLCIS